jgi:hypothetical protein
MGMVILMALCYALWVLSVGNAAAFVPSNGPS